MLMKLTFILITSLILGQASSKKRVVIHVPSKINNIHHHHVKKVIVYKPVPVKCHHHDNILKHDWQEGWESTHKDEWVDKPSPPLKHSDWLGEETVKGGYISGERISSYDWDAAGIKPFKAPHSEMDPEGDEEPVYNDYLPTHSSKKKPFKSRPSDWKQMNSMSWTPSEAIRVPEPPIMTERPIIMTAGKRPKLKETLMLAPTPLKPMPSETPAEYTTFKVVKTKGTKQRAKRPKINLATKSSWFEDGYKTPPKPLATKPTTYANMKDSWQTMDQLKSPRPMGHPFGSYNSNGMSMNSNMYVPDMYETSSTQNKLTYSNDFYGTSSSKPQMSQGFNSFGPSNPQPFFDQNVYIVGNNDPSQETYPQLNNPPKMYYDHDTYLSSSSKPMTYDQDPFSFNSQKIKALLDQNVQTTTANKLKPSYGKNSQSSKKHRSKPSSYQMGYFNTNDTKPTSFMVSH